MNRISADSTLPNGWDSRDIGDVGVAGDASYASGAYNVTGSGADIWGTADSFHFLSRRQDFGVDSGSLSARVVSEQFTSSYAKAGVMLRKSYDASAAHVVLDVKPDGGVEFMIRAQDGGTTQFVAGATGAFPIWLRLQYNTASVTAQISQDGTSWATIGSTPFAVTDIGFTGLVVTSHDRTFVNQSTFDNVVNANHLGNSGLAGPWIQSSVGNANTAADGATYSNGTFSVTGSGADIWGTADAFHFVYQEVVGNGDAEMFARLTGMQSTNPFAKAGVMLRESLDDNAGSVILDVKPDGGVEFMARQTAGAATTFIGGASLPAPAWLKLIRSDGVVSGYVSSDDQTWVKVGEVAVSWPDQSNFMGLAVTSHDASATETATFDNVLLGLSSQDIGDVGLDGSVTFVNYVMTIAAAGADIWGTSDSFHFVYMPLSGESIHTVHARVLSLQNTSAFAKAGLMIRESTDANAANVVLDVKPDGSVEFMARTAAGAPTTFILGDVEPSLGDMNLLLSYDGQAVTAYIQAADADGFRKIGSVPMSFSTNALIGLVVTSHDRGTLNTAVFDTIGVHP